MNNHICSGIRWIGMVLMSIAFGFVVGFLLPLTVGYSFTQMVALYSHTSLPQVIEISGMSGMILYAFSRIMRDQEMPQREIGFLRVFEFVAIICSENGWVESHRIAQELDEAEELARENADGRLEEFTSDWKDFYELTICEDNLTFPKKELKTVYKLLAITQSTEFSSLCKEYLEKANYEADRCVGCELKFYAGKCRDKESMYQLFRRTLLREFKDTYSKEETPFVSYTATVPSSLLAQFHQECEGSFEAWEKEQQEQLDKLRFDPYRPSTTVHHLDGDGGLGECSTTWQKIFNQAQINRDVKNIYRECQRLFGDVPKLHDTQIAEAILEWASVSIKSHEYKALIGRTVRDKWIANHQPKSCEYCHTILEAESKFCPNCGASIKMEDERK